MGVFESKKRKEARARNQAKIADLVDKGQHLNKGKKEAYRERCGHCHGGGTIGGGKDCRNCQGGYITRYR